MIIMQDITKWSHLHENHQLLESSDKIQMKHNMPSVVSNHHTENTQKITVTAVDSTLKKTQGKSNSFSG